MSRLPPGSRRLMIWWQRAEALYDRRQVILAIAAIRLSAEASASGHWAGSTARLSPCGDALFPGALSCVSPAVELLDRSGMLIGAGAGRIDRGETFADSGSGVNILAFCCCHWVEWS